MDTMDTMDTNTYAVLRAREIIAYADGKAYQPGALFVVALDDKGQGGWQAIPGDEAYQMGLPRNVEEQEGYTLLFVPATSAEVLAVVSSQIEFEELSRVRGAWYAR